VGEEEEKGEEEEGERKEEERKEFPSSNFLVDFFPNTLKLL
jgi:hypothetical protein